MQWKSNDESAWKIPSGDGPPLSLRGFYARQSPIVNTIIRAFCTSALPNNRREVVETAPRRGRGWDAFAEPIFKGWRLGLPCREGTGEESVRFRLRFRYCSLREGRGDNGVRFDKLNELMGVEGSNLDAARWPVPHLSEE